MMITIMIKMLVMIMVIIISATAIMMINDEGDVGMRGADKRQSYPSLASLLRQLGVSSTLHQHRHHQRHFCPS